VIILTKQQNPCRLGIARFMTIASIVLKNFDIHTDHEDIFRVIARRSQTLLREGALLTSFSAPLLISFHVSLIIIIVARGLLMWLILREDTTSSHNNAQSHTHIGTIHWRTPQAYKK
jgi:hypothetical protein